MEDFHRHDDIGSSTPDRVAASTKHGPQLETLQTIAINYRDFIIKDSVLLQTALSSSASLSVGSSRARMIRNEILHICSVAGELCSSMMVFVEATPTLQQKEGMAKLLLNLLYTANVVCNMNLFDCIIKKIALNARKYPAKLCRGKSGKYTKYSDATGITKTEGQSTLEEVETLDPKETLNSLCEKIDIFAREREWDQYHTPRNITLALLGEVGELAELFQWKGDCCDSIGDEIFWDQVGQEMADIAIYLLRMATVSDVDLVHEATSFGVQTDDVYDKGRVGRGKSPRSAIIPLREDKLNQN